MFQVGVNLGGWISQYPAYDHDHFRAFITGLDLQKIAGWGMDHVRLPVDYPVLESDERPFEYREDGFAYIDHCLGWCDQTQLGTIIDLHRAPGFSFNQAADATLFGNLTLQDRFVALWEAMAKRYRGVGESLAFELLNEIVLPTSTPWNQLARRALAAIRAIDPQRLVIVGGNYFNSAAQLTELDLPNDPQLLYTFHYYDPMPFTHQKAGWVPILKEYDQTVEYPGECPNLREFLVQHPDDWILNAKLIGQRFGKDTLRAALQPAVEFIQKTGHPLYCGEFGAIDCAPMDSRIRWYRDFISLLREYGIGRAAWSYKQMDFGLVDADGQVVNEELVRIVSESSSHYGQ